MSLETTMYFFSALGFAFILYWVGFGIGRRSAYLEVTENLPLRNPSRLIQKESMNLKSTSLTESEAR